MCGIWRGAALVPRGNAVAAVIASSAEPRIVPASQRPARLRSRSSGPVDGREENFDCTAACPPKGAGPVPPPLSRRLGVLVKAIGSVIRALPPRPGAKSQIEALLNHEFRDTIKPELIALGRFHQSGLYRFKRATKRMNRALRHSAVRGSIARTRPVRRALLI